MDRSYIHSFIEQEIYHVAGNVLDTVKDTESGKTWFPSQGISSWQKKHLCTSTVLIEIKRKKCYKERYE